jgi:hypothetical protein
VTHRGYRVPLAVHVQAFYTEFSDGAKLSSLRESEEESPWPEGARGQEMHINTRGGGIVSNCAGLPTEHADCKRAIVYRGTIVIGPAIAPQGNKDAVLREVGHGNQSRLDAVVNEHSAPKMERSRVGWFPGSPRQLRGCQREPCGGMPTLHVSPSNICHHAGMALVLREQTSNRRNIQRVSASGELTGGIHHGK